jgi:hypothetical protein
VAKGGKSKITALFRTTCKFGGGGYGKKSARLGVKIPAAVCGPKLRDEFFVNSTLRVILSLDPQTDDQPVLEGLEIDHEFPTAEIMVTVSSYSLNDSDVGFSMSFGKTDLPAEFLQTISHASGTIYILTVKANEDGKASDVVDDDDTEEDSEE